MYTVSFERIWSLYSFVFTLFFNDHWPPNVADQLSDGDSYDFIVVGSGSAGSPVAARLAQRGQNVLLLEAGGKPPITTVIPGLSFFNQFTDKDWQFTSEQDKQACQSYFDKRCFTPSGKVLGGSSAINFMIHVRGNRADYDDWNCSSWTYDQMLPYFRRLESLSNYDDLSPELKHYHNNNGPLKVSLLNSSFIPWRDYLLNAYREIGFVRNWDVNGPSQTGITFTHNAIYNGERQSTAKAYLVPNAKNKNLNVAYNSYVTKVIINKNNVAKGVRVNIASKREISIKAKKEIIISAGTINTPRLLMLSGIGPKSDLKRHIIKVRVDNPHVGQHLQDHPATSIILTANTGTATSISEFTFHMNNLLQWLYDRSGLYGTNLGTDMSAFIDTVHKSSIPDVQFLHGFINRSKSFLARYGLKKFFSFTDNIIDDIQKLKEDSDILLVMPVLLRPVSRGSIQLASKNPHDYPKVHSNTLNKPEDYKTYLRAIRLLEKLLLTDAFMKNNVQLAKLISLNECNAYMFRSDDYWICYRKHLGNTIFHPVGTASIGRVVDEKLRVYGVTSLRVADASVMPFISRGNTNAPTIAIGERAADFISNDHNFSII